MDGFEVPTEMAVSAGRAAGQIASTLIKLDLAAVTAASGAALPGGLAAALAEPGRQDVAFRALHVARDRLVDGPRWQYVEVRTGQLVSIFDRMTGPRAAYSRQHDRSFSPYLTAPHERLPP